MSGIKKCLCCLMEINHEFTYVKIKDGGCPECHQKLTSLIEEDKSEVKSEAIKSDINDTLDGREATYGKFSGQAAKCQALKDVMHGCEEWDDLSPSMKEALEMIVHKAARILNGKGCNYKDNWHDIAGYATLIEREIEENESD